MSNPVIVGLIVAGIFAMVIALIAISRQNNVKKLSVDLPGGVGIRAEGLERPKGAATIEDVRAGRNVRAGNQAGGDASVKGADAQGDVSANVADRRSGQGPN